jgi:predicted phosphate transport protein (TIGR00153 family)
VGLLPRDQRFFDLFTTVSERTLEAAHQLEELLKAVPERRGPIVDAIKRLEHECDTLTHEVITRLDRSFITPLDREDIHALASKLDDVMDLIDGLSRRSQMFRVGVAPEGAILMAAVLARACEQLLIGVRNLAKPGSPGVLEACIMVKRMEEEGDSVYHEWMGKLFDESQSPVELIKWKELYDTLEKTLDYCEDAANVLESISIKHG